MGETVRAVAASVRGVKNRPEEFNSIQEYVEAFSQKMTSLDRITQRITKEEKGTQNDQTRTYSVTLKHSGQTFRSLHGFRWKFNKGRLQRGCFSKTVSHSQIVSHLTLPRYFSEAVRFVNWPFSFRVKMLMFYSHLLENSLATNLCAVAFVVNWMIFDLVPRYYPLCWLANHAS